MKDKYDVERQTNYYFGDYNEKLVNEVAAILGDSFVLCYRKTGVTFFGRTARRILKLVNKQKELVIEFNVPVNSEKNITVLSDKEAREKKMGTCRWIYRGESFPVHLIEEAKENYLKLLN